MNTLPKSGTFLLGHPVYISYSCQSCPVFVVLPEPGRQRYESSIPNMDKRFFSYPDVQTGSGPHSTVCKGGLFSCVKATDLWTSPLIFISSRLKKCVVLVPTDRRALVTCFLINHTDYFVFSVASLSCSSNSFGFKVFVDPVFFPITLQIIYVSFFHLHQLQRLFISTDNQPFRTEWLKSKQML